MLACYLRIFLALSFLFFFLYLVVIRLVSSFKRVNSDSIHGQVAKEKETPIHFTDLGQASPSVPHNKCCPTDACLFQRLNHVVHTISIPPLPFSFLFYMFLLYVFFFSLWRTGGWTERHEANTRGAGSFAFCVSLPLFVFVWIGTRLIL
ncbi:hypothetical protein LI328DRAFT_58107 [Trichoderma asperelloides]|nr:hypothetical protein LI328DRAFT_58107 [Trichoderma asperelloides]